MITALLALPFAAQLVVPAPLETLRDAVLHRAYEQSQFTSAQQNRDTMRFREMDRNGDGVITRAEWRGTEQTFRSNDWNADGILSGDEVRQGAQPPVSDQVNQREDLREDRLYSFENLDRNVNGVIERAEWQDSDDAFRWLDRDQDGTLSRREVVGGRRARTGTARGRPDATDPRAAAVGTAGRETCEQSAARVVDDLYKQVLERPADNASSGFTEALASGRTTVKEIVSQLAKSEEHSMKFSWLPVTRTVYRDVLNRDPSNQEEQQMTAALASGAPLIDVMAQTVRRAASTDEEAVRILYRRLLGREADPEGLRGFTEQARQRGIESVARDLVASAEYRQRGGRLGLPIEERAYENGVRATYRHVLNRDPDAGAMRSFTQMAAENGFDAVIDALVEGMDYQRLYGTDVVPGKGTRYCASTR